jgi:hypothetical protein
MTVNEELQSYFDIIVGFSKDMGQDGSALHEYMIELTNYAARANNILAEYKRKLREEKRKAYITLSNSYHARQKYFAPTLAKDYVDCECSETAFTVDLSERLSRSCVHTIDALRTIISSLKSEREFSKFN